MSGQRRLDRLLDDAYLAELSALTTSEIRRMRDECEEEESGISFARRILQGKLDILRAEALRRQREDGTTTGTTTGTLLAALPTILRDEPGAPAIRARVTRFLVPPSVQYHRRSVERLVDDEVLASVSERPTEELARLVEVLSEKERDLSLTRRQLLERLDALQSELTRRYKDGVADVQEVLPRLG